MANKNEIDKSENIILGSGDLYVVEYSGTIPDDATIEADDNRAGNISGGATLTYSATTKTVQDDKGRVKKTVITEESVGLKTGVITWIDRFLKSVVKTARVDTTTKSGHRIIKLGGLDNEGKEKYLYRFVHTRDDGRKLRVTVTGVNTGTLTLNFNNDNATQVDAEITADPLDDEGTLVILDDELTKDAASVSAAAVVEDDA